MTRYAITIASILVPLLLAPGPAAAKSVRQRLSEGEIIVQQRKVKGVDLPKAIVRAVIDAPPAVVWEIVENCNGYEKVMPRTKSAKELSRKGNKITCKVTVDLPWPLSDLTATTKIVHEVKGNRYVRRWSLLEGDYHRNDGSWTLTPFDKAGKRTLVVYEVLADPKIAVPGWLQRMASKSTLKDLIESVRREAVRRARKRKPKAAAK